MRLSPLLLRIEMSSVNVSSFRPKYTKGAGWLQKDNAMIQETASIAKKASSGFLETAY